MIKRVCSGCKADITIDKTNNVGNIYYKNKYYHLGCFRKMCETKINTPRSRKNIWESALNNIPQFQADFKGKIELAIAKDNIFEWICQQYNISMVGNRTFEKLDQIYMGKLKGQSYPIAPEELLDEWKYFMKDLKAMHYRKNLACNDSTVLYDLSVLVNWNANYRSHLHNIEATNRARKREKATKEYIDYSKIQGLKGIDTRSDDVNLSSVLDDIM